MTLGPIGPQRQAPAPATRNWVADVYGKPANPTDGARSGVSPSVRQGPSVRQDLVAAVVPGSIVGGKGPAGPQASRASTGRLNTVDVVDVSTAAGPQVAASSGAASTGVYSMYRRPADRMEAAVGVEAGRINQSGAPLGGRLDVQG